MTAITAHERRARAAALAVTYGDDPGRRRLVEALRRLASPAVSCARCGRDLDDDLSRAIGLGLECRRTRRDSAMRASRVREYLDDDVDALDPVDPEMLGQLAVTLVDEAGP